jgi:hypothetical protein
LDTNTILGFASAGAAGIAVLVTAYQIRVGRIQARRQATFEHIRSALRAAQAGVRDLNPEVARSDILQSLRDSKVQQSECAKNYLNFLDELDILGFAYKYGTVDRPMVREYFRSHLTEHLLPQEFHREYREAAQDEFLLEHLADLIIKLSRPSVYHRVSRRIRQFRFSKTGGKEAERKESGSTTASQLIGSAARPEREAPQIKPPALKRETRPRPRRKGVKVSDNPGSSGNSGGTNSQPIVPPPPPPPSRLDEGRGFQGIRPPPTKPNTSSGE